MLKLGPVQKRAQTLPFQGFSRHVQGVSGHARIDTHIAGVYLDAQTRKSGVAVMPGDPHDVCDGINAPHTVDREIWKQFIAQGRHIRSAA